MKNFGVTILGTMQPHETLGMAGWVRSSAVALWLCLSAHAATQLYVAPGGSGHEFSAQRPGQLQQVVHHLPPPEKGDVEILLRGGAYFLEQPLVLDHTCTGAPGSRRIFRACDGEQPVLSGGRQIKDWTRIDSEKNIWQADTSAIAATFRQLYVNGVDAVRARHPNQLRRYSQQPTLKTRDLDFDASVICVNGSDLPEALLPDTALAGLELIIHGVWYHTRLDIDRYSLDGELARLHSTQFDILNHDPRKKPGERKYFVPREYFLEGHRSLLDAPGEWSHDKAARTLYYIPRPGEDPNQQTIMAPVTETLLSIGSGPDHPTGHIEFHGIDFEYTTWLDPETTGLDFTQGLRRGPSVDGMVELRHAHHLRFVGNRFRGAGMVGFLVEKAMKHAELRGNVFELIMGNGLQLGTTYDFEDIDKTEHVLTGPRTNIQNKGASFCPMINTPVPKEDPRFESIKQQAGLQGDARALRSRLVGLPSGSGRVEAERMHLSGLTVAALDRASGGKVAMASAPVFDHLPKKHRPAEAEFIFDGAAGKYGVEIACAAGEGRADLRFEVDCDWDRTESMPGWKWRLSPKRGGAKIQVCRIEAVSLRKHDRLTVRLFYSKGGGARLDYVQVSQQ